MYCPTHFEEQRQEALQQLIADHPLAIVIWPSPEGLVADHIPLVLRPATAGLGQLVGHVARANPLWQMDPSHEVLLIFQGPQTYISPNWYATKADGGKVVPTWNYVAVHVQATLSVVHEPDAVLDILQGLTQKQESSQRHPWQVSDAPEAFTRTLLNHIVGVRFEIRRMQGKWKVSQNQPGANRSSVASALMALEQDNATAMAQLVTRA